MRRNHEHPGKMKMIVSKLRDGGRGFGPGVMDGSFVTFPYMLHDEFQVAVGNAVPHPFFDLAGGHPGISPYEFTDPPQGFS